MVEPSELKAFRRHAEWAVVAATAHELGVYDLLAEGALTTGSLSEELSLHPRGTGILLRALEEMDLVRQEPDGRWIVTGEARGFFVDPDTPDYQADALSFWLRNIRLWTARLPEAVRTGAPVEEEPDGEELSEEESVARFMRAMANKNPDLVEAVVDEALARAPEPIGPESGRVLDLGGGPGTFAREFLDRGWEAVLYDKPEVIEHVAGAYGLEDLPGLELMAGDFLESLPEEEFDVVLLANITHIYPAETNARLLERVADRLRPGGVVAIMDFVREVEEFASLFAVTMLMNTEEGDTHGLRQYERWLEDAGLSEVRCRTVLEDRQVVTGLRR